MLIEHGVRAQQHADAEASHVSRLKASIARSIPTRLKPARLGGEVSLPVQGAAGPVLKDEALVGFQGGETGIGKFGCGHLVREQKRE